MTANARLSSVSLLFVLILLGLTQGPLAQQAASARKLVQKTAAEYPLLARSMALQGVVKLDVLVAPDGTMKSAEIKGGHPVLAQAAINTVRRWKWEPAPHDTHELVDIRFSPE